MPDGKLHPTEAWSFCPDGSPGLLAVSDKTGHALIADSEQKVYLLDGAGALRATLDLEAPVVGVCQARDGSAFAAMLGDGSIVGIGPDGLKLWTVELAEGLTCFDMTGAHGYLAAAGGDPSFYGYHIAERAKEEFVVAHQVCSIALVRGDGSSVLVAGQAGDVSLLDGTGKVIWHHDVHHRCGPVRVSANGEFVVLPVYEEGVHAFLINGEGAGAYGPGEEVVEAKVDSTGSFVAMKTSEQSVILMDREGIVWWKRAFEQPVAAFDVNADASKLMVALQGGEVICIELALETEEAAEDIFEFVDGVGAPLEEETERAVAAVGGRGTPKLELKEESEAGKGRSSESQADLRTPTVLWEKDLREGVRPGDPSHFFLTHHGRFVVTIFPAGKVVVFDRKGRTVLTTQIDVPAWMKRKRSEQHVCVWNPHSVIILALEEGRSQSYDIGTASTEHLDCSEDSDLICTIDESGRLSGIGPGGEHRWQRAVRPPPQRLLVSPNGQLVVTEDGEGRYRYYDGDGKLIHKHRFSPFGVFPHAVLEDTFSAVGGRDGRLVIVDRRGRKLWAGSVGAGICRLESLLDALGVYEEGGRCSLVDPYGHVLWGFGPPPGRCLLRHPADRDPVLLHVSGKVLTVFGGYHRKIQPLKRFTCGEAISLFEADCEGRTVALVAGRKVCLLDTGLR